MVAPIRRNGGAQLFLLLAAVIGLAFASPAPSLQNLRKIIRDNARIRLFSTTTTTPAPSFNELTCEEKFENAERFTYNETALQNDIRKLMNTYYDWGDLLAPAPIAISVLGKLIIMSTQRMDFPINDNVPTGGFKFIKYPKSFRTTLLQISHDGYLAFLKAHTNMDKIRMYNSNVPSHIKDATRYLMSRKDIYILNLLPISLKSIKEAADQSKELSQEVVKEFKLVVELIQETILAVSDTKSEKEVKLKGVELDIKLSEISRNFSLNETKLLEEKNQMLSGMLGGFGYRQKNIFVRTIYGNEDFVINLSKEWLSQTGGRYEKHREIFFGKSNWLYNYTDERVENDKCIEQNNQHLLDLIIVMGQYRLKYESWQNSDTIVPFEGGEDVGKLEMSLNSLVQCSTVNVIVTNLSALIKRLQKVEFKMLQKTSARPGAEEMDGIILKIKNLRSESNPKKKEERKSTRDGFKDVNLMETWSKVYHQQFDMLQSLINVTGDIMKVNNKQMELRRQKTQQVLERIKSLDITKISYKEAIQALQEGLEELGNLKTVWTKLIEFYSKMSIFITEATKQSIALVEIVRVIANDTKTLDDEEVFGNLLDNVQKANEASFLVYGVSDMYVNVSDKYIMDRIASLDSMMNIDASEVGLDDIVKVQQKLIASGEEASKGIAQYIKADETLLREKLVVRHNEIMNEYQWMIDCTSPEDRKFKNEE